MVEGLSGRYFNYVLGFHSGLIQRPLVIRVGTSNPRIVGEPIEFGIKNQVQLLRVIVETENNEGTVFSRHSNLVLIDTPKKKILHFEPMVNPNHMTVSKVLVDALRPNFRGYEYVESDLHPQKDQNNKYCVAYTILFAMDYLLGTQQMNKYQFNISEYANSIKNVYPLSVSEQSKDIEFGVGGLGAGLALGALGGLAIGGALAATASPRMVVVAPPPYNPYVRYY